MEEYGKSNPVEPIPATKDQLASICYTSVGATNSLMNLPLKLTTNADRVPRVILRVSGYDFRPYRGCGVSLNVEYASGVMLTHCQLAMGAQANLFGYTIPPSERGCIFSYLPLAHIYEVDFYTIIFLATTPEFSHY